MAFRTPRDEREWRTMVERGLRETKSGIRSAVESAVGDVIVDVEQNNARHPTAPIELTYQTARYLSSSGGRYQARFILDFPDVTKATDGTDITVAQYELWGKPVSAPLLELTTDAVTGLAAPGVTLPGLAATPANKAIAAVTQTWKRIATSAASYFRADGFTPGTLWDFRARAIGSGMVTPGEWSTVVHVQMVEDDTPPSQPTAPILSVNRGTITARWDGMAVNGAMPADFRYVVLAHGTDTSPTQEIARFTRGGGFTVVSDFPYYDPQFFRLKAVDESGNESPWSEQAVAYTTPLVDTDVILSTIDAAKTHLKNINAGVSILPNTIITENLAVTEEMTAALAQFLHVRAGMMEANAVEADNIKAGAVTASKLEADLALVTAIIAGDPMGTHAQMDQYGFRVFAADEADGIPNEVVRMGVAATDDYFAITRANGTLAATISQDGVASFSEVNANDAFYYKGTELTSVLAEFSKGIVANGYHDFGGPGGPGNIYVGSNSFYGVMATGWLARPRRTYRVTFLTPTWSASTGGELQWAFKLRVVDAADTSTPTLSNTGTWRTFIRTYSSAGSWESDTYTAFINTADDLIGKKVQIIVAAWHGPTGNTGFVQLFQGTELVVEDIGDKGVIAPSYHTSGGGSQFDGDPVPPPPTTQTYTTQWGANNSLSYTGSNAFYNYNTGKMYQGLSPAGYGNLKSIATFNDMTGALSGATINYIRVYFNFNHWYYNSGGTARIGLHGHSSPPGTFTGNQGIVITSGGWPKPGARWLDIPAAHWWGFQSGAYKGVYLEGDGTYNTYGYADRPTIEISYTK